MVTKDTPDGQLGGAELDLDTTTKHYDPENEGAWDGQLAVAGMPPVAPPVERKTGGPLDRSKWVISHAPALGHAAFKLLVVMNDYANASGICWPSRAALMGQSGMSGSAVDRAIGELKRSGAVDVIQDGKGRKSNTWQLSGGLNDWAKTPQTPRKWGIKLPESGELNSPKVGNGTLLLQNPIINPRDPGVVDAKREPDGVTAGVINSFFSEEERTGTGAEPGQQPTPEPSKPTDPTVSAPPSPSDLEEARAFVDGVLSEIPTDSEIEGLGKHCWPEWSKHWGGGWAAAWSTWTKDTAGRKKFRNDVVAQLAKVGLPKPMEPNVEDQAARERSSSWLDLRLSEGPQRMVDVKCAGCGQRRQLQPGQPLCYPCRKEVVEIAA